MNNKLSLLLSVLSVVAVSTALIHWASGLSTADNVIRIAHDSKENSPLHQAMLLFEQEVETASGNELKVEIYPARQLGVVRETTELVQQGNLQMTVGASVLLTAIVPQFNVLDMFYLFRDVDHAHRSLDDSEIGGKLLSAMAEKGFKGLGFMEVGFRSISSSKRPIETIADLEGLKIRAASNPAQILAWESLGTAPTPLSWGEIFTSLQQGLINTQESSVYSIYTERFYEAQDYLSLTEHIYTNYVWFANHTFWARLSEKNQSIVEKAVKRAIEMQRELAHKQNQEVIVELEENGMQVNVVSEDVRVEMKNRLNNSVYALLRDKTGSMLFDEIISRIQKD